ncbi:APC family permease [Amnibacterium endophyticum]|uniref:APC family permease n=1 Tax=Amnibacterium endophyticum TaxID=2109337 RepID=A0ABW4LGP7_9MICO
MAEHGLKRDVGRIGLLFAAIGSMIGSGWLFGAFNASAIAGPAAIFSWLIGGVMILFIGLSYAELGPMFPISGGVIRYPHIVWGSFGSYSLGFITWISTAAVPAIEVEGALQYATQYAPFTSPEQVGGETVYTLTPLGIGTAAVLLAVFVAINAVGVKLFAQVNNVLVWWKLGVIALVVAVFIATALLGLGGTGGFANYGTKQFAPGGFDGVMIAISTAGIVFSFLGFRQSIELAGESKDPKRNVPWAVITATLVVAGIYALLQVAFTLAVPADALARADGWRSLSLENDFGPLAAIAGAAGLTWLAILLYADAIISPADTGLVYTTIASRVSYAFGRNGNAPRWLATTSARGVPWWSLVLVYGIGLVLLLPFPSWQQLVGFITSGTVISFAAGPLAVTALRRTEPDRERPFRLPGGHAIPLLGFFSANLIVYFTGWATNSKLFITILIGYAVLVVLELVGRRSGTKPPLELASGWWVLPWLGALALVAWLLDPETHPTLFLLGFPIIAVISIAVYALAVSRRLPRERMDEYIADAEREAQDEPEAVSV